MKSWRCQEASLLTEYFICSRKVFCVDVLNWVHWHSSFLVGRFVSWLFNVHLVLSHESSNSNLSECIIWVVWQLNFLIMQLFYRLLFFSWAQQRHFNFLMSISQHRKHFLFSIQSFWTVLIFDFPQFSGRRWL
jgi:hypothetical protein